MVVVTAKDDSVSQLGSPSRAPARALRRLILMTASTTALGLSAIAVAALGTVALPTIVHAAECIAGASANGGDDNGVPTNTACGQNAVANGTGGATAIGSASSASGTGSTAVGNKAKSTGLESTAVGSEATASGNFSSAYGVVANATGLSSSAFGHGADAIGANSSALGTQALANGANSTAVGVAAKALGASSLAVGSAANAEAENSTAVGAGASATAKGSAAFGAGAVANRENQQAFGTKDNTYTMAGITSDGSKTAQGAPTHIVTSNANGDLAAHTAAELGLASLGDITNLQSQINRLDERDDELADGIAISMALSQPFFHNGQKFALNLGWGNFEGNNALGLTAAGIVDRGMLGPTSTTTVYGGVGVGLREGTVGGRAGLTFGW